MPLIKHDAEGLFPFPYLSVTCGQHYGNNIFSWDNHHMTLRFAAAGEPEQMRYFLDNLLKFQNADGYVPCVVNAINGSGCGNFHAQPFLAQNAAVYTKITGEKSWTAEVFPKLKKYVNYWLENHAAPFGLYRWRETFMSGFDNEIAGTIFQPDTIIPPDLNSWLYLELRNMAYLAEIVQDDAECADYLEKAEKLKKAINDYLWDEQYGSYAAYDLCIGKTRIAWSDGSLNEQVGAFAYLSCPALIPLFARIAGREQAERMIKNYVLKPEHFRSPFGIRSLSKASEYYNNARWGNPPRFGDHRRLTNSNWQGPVWIPLNWFVFHALLYYGFRKEAEELASDTLKVIASSVEKYGFMRENFHGETGEPLYADDFASWNILADLMPDYLKGSVTVPVFI
ncbi:MAG: trehalase family glycosidase [Victivallales bacterium]